jgi:hypothetical protein
MAPDRAFVCANRQEPTSVEQDHSAEQRGERILLLGVEHRAEPTLDRGMIGHRRLGEREALVGEFDQNGAKRASLPAGRS